MIQLLIHLWGDYILQNNWMANKKTKFTFEGWLACLIHCFLYTLPFALFLHPSSAALWVIFGTHFLMDKFRLAKYITRFTNWNFSGNGFSEATPVWLSTWLVFIVDNIIHVTINYLSIANL